VVRDHVPSPTTASRCGQLPDVDDLRRHSAGVARQHGGGTHLYGYGPHASSRAFGHSGFRTTVAFCDPAHDLVVACSWNGMVADDGVHSDRQNAPCGAIYEDLGLA
jgi:CubicO group peptidase (beta-lactamase class C family)